MPLRDIVGDLLVLEKGTPQLGDEIAKAPESDMHLTLKSEQLMQMLRVNGPSDMVGISLLIWKAAAIVAAVVTFGAYCFAEVAVNGTKCADIASLPSGVPMKGLWAPVLMILVIAAVFVLRAKASKMRAIVETYDAPCFEFRGIQVTLGMMMFFNTLIVGGAILGAGTVVSVLHYCEMVKYCWQ